MERVVSPAKAAQNPSVHPWDFNDVTVKEQLEWIHSGPYEVDYDILSTWMVKGPVKLSVNDETNFCDPELLQKIIQTKQQVFEKFHPNELLRARVRANPYETIKSAFFMNRAALKMANIDASTNFMFTEIDRDVHHKKPEGPYYFADICAGPGGFSEYILWRKQWAFKGFGFTLKGDHDFKVLDSTCCSGVNFNGYYGKSNDGNICSPENINDFAGKVLHETDNQGVHFTMADGGFSVEGNEHLQEVLSKQIYVCQCLMALEIVRTHGHFVTKLFDTFTLFTVGLLFLMYRCFEKIAILKPNSSRPANSERYFICSGLKDDRVVADIRKYLNAIVWELWCLKQKESSEDILTIVPLSVIQQDVQFMKYIIRCNNRLGKNQMLNLLKLEVFCEDTCLMETRQEDLRKKCLLYWRIPDRPKCVSDKVSIEDLLRGALSKPEFLYVQPRELKTWDDFSKTFSEVNDWCYTPLNCHINKNTCYIYAAVGPTKVYKLHNEKWIRVKNIRLVKGTLLYGELVIERAILKEETNEMDFKSLQVIDALRLGDTSLADLSFDERIPLINTYCKAINYETPQKLIRIRAKPLDSLRNLSDKSLLQFCDEGKDQISVLPTVGCNSLKEYYQVHSLLFFKTNQSQFFNTTYVFRAQLYLDAAEKEEIDEDLQTNYEMLLKFVKNKKCL